MTAAYPYLTVVDVDYLAVALSNYADVQAHIPGRVDELLDLVLKLGVPPSFLSKALRKQYDARVRHSAAIAAGGAAHG